MPKMKHVISRQYVVLKRHLHISNQFFVFLLVVVSSSKILHHRSIFPPVHFLFHSLSAGRENLTEEVLLRNEEVVLLRADFNGLIFVPPMTSAELNVICESLELVGSTKSIFFLLFFAGYLTLEVPHTLGILLDPATGLCGGGVVIALGAEGG